MVRDSFRQANIRDFSSKGVRMNKDLPFDLVLKQAVF